MKFTLVSTIFNEIARLETSISDIETQTLLPDEIIITDAGSTDGTYERLQQWKEESKIKIVVLQEFKCNVARGRNLAIEAAKNSLIASTDFGCRFDRRWLESIIKPFENTEVEVVGGAFTIKGQPETLAAKSDYIIQNGYPVKIDQYFSVSSRSIAYYKYIWEKCNKYPEWLTLAADDTIFWRKIKAMGFNYHITNEPLVYWGRHSTNKAFSKEAYRYGLGDGESKINYRNFWSKLVETGLRYSFFLSFVALLSIILIPLDQTNTYQGINIYIVLFSIIIVSSFGLRSYKNIFKNWRLHKSTKYNYSIFINALWQVELSRWQYIKGYITGMLDNDPKKKEGRKQLKEFLAR